MFVLFTDIIQPKVECLQKAPTTTPNSSLIVSQRKERERERGWGRQYLTKLMCKQMKGDYS